MMDLKLQEKRSSSNAQIPPLPRQTLTTVDSTFPLSRNEDSDQRLEVGYFYEIDHTRLPSNSPVQLNPVRIVKVSDKVDLAVSLRFPSMYSVRTHFSCDVRRKARMSPVLDEKFLMDSDVAGEVLRRRIPPQELSERRDSWDFWVMPASLMETETVTNPSSDDESRSRDIVSKKGKLWSEIKNDGMVQWGVRRQVMFIGRHMEQNPQISSRDSEGNRLKDAQDEVNEDTEKKEGNEGGGEEEGGGGQGVEEEGGREEAEEEEGEEEEEEEEEGGGGREQENQRNEEENDEEIVRYQTRRTRKRKRHSTRQIQKGKKEKRMIKEEKRIVLGYREPKVLRNSIDRWSAQRYKLAEEHMLMILKAKEAFVGNPILRPALRQEARKWIGDTGLLDHLLKHMAGKLAPGGNERFRRRHNAEGAMEYWLESADLADIRKEAGVQDPYWVPPAGWKPGENPNQHPICSSEIKLLKEEMAKMKRDMMELVSKKQGEGDLAIVTTPISCNTNHHMVEDIFNKQGDGDLAIVTTPIFCDTNLNMNRDDSILAQKEHFHELVKRKAKLEEQLVQVSHSLQKIEEEMGQLESASQMQRSSEKKVELIGGEEKDKATLAVGGEGEHGGEKAKAAAAAAKAAKIERLKSGFRICKPQGTFLWPNMASPPQMMAQLDDLLVVPTPPSVSSSPPLPHYLLPPPSPNSPVKPLAQRRAVPVNVSTTVTGPTTETSPSSGRGSNTTTTCNISTSHSHGGFKSTTSSTTTTTLIDLNNAPQPAPTNNKSEVNSGLRGTLTSSFSASQRGQKNPISSTTATPSMVKFKREGDTGPWEEVEGQDLVGYCKKQQQSVGCCSSSPCLSTGVGMWLALGSPTSSHQINPNR